IASKVGPRQESSVKKALYLAFFLAARLLAVAQGTASPWPIHLVGNPIHIGDSTSKEMRDPKPDATTFIAHFDLPPPIMPSVAPTIYVTIRAGDILPLNDKKYAKDFRSGRMLTRLYINGTEVAVLNKLVHGPESVTNVQTLRVAVPGTILRAGSNELEIRP